MLTKGPVFYLRIQRGPLSGDFIDDRWVQTVFVVGGLAICTVAFRGARGVWSDRVLLWPVVALVVALMASALWSVAPRRTAEQVVMMAVCAAAALLVGRWLSVPHMIVAWWVAAQSGLVVSVFALWRDWAFSRGDGGYAAGIYFNRNSLAAVAALAVITSVGAVGCVVGMRPGWARFCSGAVVAGFAVIDLELLRRTGSVTPIGGLVGTGLVAGLVLATRRLSGLSDRGAVAWALAASGCLIVALGAYSSRDRSGAGGILSGRDVVWHVVLDYVAKRPLQGWGFMAVWTKQDIANDQFARGVLVFEAHSGFLEVLLGGGILAAVPLVALGVVAISRSVTGVRSAHNLVEAWPALVVFYCLIVNLAETYVGANLHPWVLLLMATTALGRVGRGGAPLPDSGLRPPDRSL